MFYSLEKFYSNRKSSGQRWSPNQWTEDQGRPHRLRKLESPDYHQWTTGGGSGDFHLSWYLLGQGRRARCRLPYWQGICPVPTTCPIWNFLSLQIKLWFLSHDSEIVLTAKPGRWWKLSLESWNFSISDVCDASARSYTRMPIFWRPAQGKWKQGRQKITWRRTFMDDLWAVDIPWDKA